jgi:hypothetical protein
MEPSAIRFGMENWPNMNASQIQLERDGVLAQAESHADL